MLRGKEKEKITAFLGESMVFKGQLSFEGTVRLDGKLEGQIIGKDSLVLGETAQIKADIIVGSLIAKGKIFGDITATGKVEIHAGAEVFGNIRTSLLKIEEGAIFVGKCEIIIEDGKPLRIPSTVGPEKEGEGHRQLVLYPSKAEKRSV
jgi:cytoskeletal protein CcmA (bactofilin family)